MSQTMNHRPRILLLIEAALGGSGRHVTDLAAGLLKRGWDVHLAYSPMRMDQAFGRALDSLTHESRFCSWPFQIDRSLSWRDLAAYRSLQRLVKSQGPFDVIHAHSTKAGFLGRLLVAPGVRKTYTPHALMTMDPALRGVRRFAVSVLESFLAQLTHRIAVVSQEELRCAKRLFIASEKLALIPNGVEPSCWPDSRAAQRTALGIQEDEFCVGFAGRLAAQKAVGRVLEMFAEARNRVSRRLKLVIAGWGPDRLALQTAARRLGVASDTVWLGQVEARTIMPAFDVLVNCSLYEGFPYVFLEALAWGVPIVTTRVGGAEEIVSAGGTCLIVDPWNPTVFSGQVAEVILNAERYEKCRQASRNAALRFSVDSMIEATCALYGSPASFPVPVPEAR